MSQYATQKKDVERTQREKLIDRITYLLNNNPSRALHLTILVDEKNQPLTWFVDEPLKLESRQVAKMEEKKTE